MTTNQILRNALLSDGNIVDVEIRDGVVSRVSAPGPGPGRDLTGFLLTTAFADPHIHLDKALTDELVDNPSGTLEGAMTNYEQVLLDDTAERIRTRARTVARELIGFGVGWARVHVGCGRLLGNVGIEAISSVREEVAQLIDIEIVAHIGGPGQQESWKDHRRRLIDALDAGADLVGGNPWSEADPDAALRECFDVAVQRGVGVDFHIDETTENNKLQLRDLVELARSAEIAVTASHCVLLGVQEGRMVSEVAMEIAEAGVSVVVLPATNLYLQGRDTWPRPRGLPPIDSLRAAGVHVAAGSDNIRDPFNPVGSADPFRTAGLCVVAGHQTPMSAWRMIGSEARALLGADPRDVEPGVAADLVAVRAASVADAIATAPSERKVWRRGWLISETVVSRRGALHDV